MKEVNTSVTIIPIEKSEGVYDYKPLLVKEYSEEAKASISFGSATTASAGSKYKVYDLEQLIKTKNFDKSIYDVRKYAPAILGGLDAWHATKKAKAIDYISANGSSEANKLEISNLLAGSIGSIKSENILSVGGETVVDTSTSTISAPTPTANIDDSTLKQLKDARLAINKLFSMGATVGASGIDDDKFNRYMFKKNIMLVGPAGSSKTYSASQWCFNAKIDKTIDSYILAAGSEAMEAVDLLGMMVPNDTGTLTWVDGPFTQAFRKAAAGKKTVFLYDEILRTPQRELSLLVDTLTPKADGYLYLRTNRIASVTEDGIGYTEEIRCKPENLWVIGASNIGAGFAVDDMDTAFQDRFRTFRVESSAVLAKKIALDKCKEYKFDVRVADHLTILFEQFQELKAKGNLQKTFSIRHISEVFLPCVTEADIYESLEDMRYTVLSINSNGIVNKAESKLFDSLIMPLKY